MLLLKKTFVTLCYLKHIKSIKVSPMVYIGYWLWYRQETFSDHYRIIYFCEHVNNIQLYTSKVDAVTLLHKIQFDLYIKRILKIPYKNVFRMDF